MNSGRGVLINMLVFMSLILIVAGFAFVKSPNTAQVLDQSYQQSQAEAQYKHEEAMAALNPEVVEIESRESEIKSSYAAIAAVAASADVSQTKIAQAIPASLWAVAVIVIGVVVIMLLLLKGKGNSQPQGDYAPLFMGKEDSRRK